VRVAKIRLLTRAVRCDQRLASNRDRQEADSDVATWY
jgi:hypothetical protein